ncbi:hypothetical protein AYI68_g588 [Smittium mucronatum]|uniref:Uncharacterized protein n=1 Tax=Smittium mucronatum TaxID=133383 RepID=A0A1R0H823_9FUNG|nr:hypothetical protein AYI68_g588 [Smittium mucronatum]
MDVGSETEKACHTEYQILEGQTNNIEWKIVPPRDHGSGDLYRCQRQSLGDRCGIPLLLRYFRENMVSLPEEEYTTSGSLRFLNNKPSRRNQQTNCAERVVTI